MPYYQEAFWNRPVTSSLRTHLAPARYAEFVAPVESVNSLSFRNRPHSNARTFSEVADIVADPYASFLSAQAPRPTASAVRANPSLLDRGHAFDLTRTILTGTQATFDTYTNKGVRYQTWQNARLIPSNVPTAGVHNGTFTVNPTISSQADAFAQAAYGKIASSLEVFDAATFLGELREGLPKLSLEGLKSATKAAKDAGSNYLGVEFGWKPLISDLQKAGEALASASSLLGLGLGKPVFKRIGSMPTRLTSSHSWNGALSKWAGLGAVAAKDVTTSNAYGTCVTNATKTLSVDRWMEALVTIRTPLGFDPSDFFSRLDVLVNGDITPGVLWELAPWSWLVDWQLRVGDAIDGALAAADDKLIMHYGYSMEHTVATVTATWNHLSDHEYSWTDTNMPRSGHVFRSFTRKRRLRANPFGFKPLTGSGSLTANQSAILGALGLSKGVR